MKGKMILPIVIFVILLCSAVRAGVSDFAGYFDIDLEKETRISLDMLKSKGHKKIGFIGGYENRRGVEQTISSANEIRFEAYIRWMKEEGAENYINYQLGQWMPLSGYEMAKRMIE